MGSSKSKEPAPFQLNEKTIEIKCSYIMHAKKVHGDRDVTSLERTERQLIDKYSDDQKTLDNMMFRDELMMCSCSVRRIQAIKKAVVYIRFLSNAKKFVSESNQVFERLPESTAMAVKNIIFASKYIGDKDICEFAHLLLRFYWKSEEVQNAANWEGVDTELKRDCMVVLNQSIPDKELIDYYIDFMSRNNRTPICGNFGRNAAPPPGGFVQPNNFGGNGGNNYGGGGGGGQLNQNPNQQMMYQPTDQQNPYLQQNMPQQPMPTQNNGGFYATPNQGLQQNMPLAQGGYNMGTPISGQPQKDCNDQDEFADQLAGLKLGKGD